MTVSDLIEILKLLPPENNVIIFDQHGIPHRPMASALDRRLVHYEIETTTVIRPSYHD